MSNINIPEPRLMVVMPYDPSCLKDIEKAIIGSDLGLNPHNDGKVLRVVIPELTEERRKELIKVVKKIAEEHRISMRQVRREANEDLKKGEKDKDITEDDLHKGMDLVQKRVDKTIEKFDKLVEGKEKELLEI
jgi:ribosome recycling factor